MRKIEFYVPDLQEKGYGEVMTYIWVLSMYDRHSGRQSCSKGTSDK